MEIILTYERELTGLSGLQEHRIIYYSLTEETVRGCKLYGAQITQISAHSTEHDSIRPFTDNRARAEALLTLLFENAVSVAHCRAVINDACTAFDGIGCDDHGACAIAHCG